MRHKPLQQHLPLASAISAVLAGAAPAHAADEPALENIIVTAQKREENLQQVPLSIQAINTQKLEELHVSSFDDYAQYLPSVAFTTLGPGFAAVYMRGVASGENGNHSGPLPSVGVYLDEQPITTITGPLDLHVYDVARVEALAGPQGTLYGASSEAGTLRIITNKPDPSAFKAGFDIESNHVDHGDFGETIEGFVNLPLSQKMAIRLVGWQEHDAGFIDNVAVERLYPSSGITDSSAPRAKKNYNNTDIAGARGALKIDLNDNWTITPQLMTQEERASGILAEDSSLGSYKVGHFFPEKTKDKWWQAALTVEGKISNFDLVYAGAYLARDVHELSDYSDYSFFYDTLNGSGAYIYDNAGELINPGQYIRGFDRYKKQSHEIRISSPSDLPFRFVGGVFVQRQTHGIEQRYIINGLADSISVPGWADTLWLTEQTRVDRDYAAFGELSYDITDKLTVMGGIRFFKAKNSLEGFFGFGDGFSSHTGVSQCFQPLQSFAGNSPAPCKNLDKEVEERGNTPKVNVTYKFTPDIMAYATYSKGFRPPGLNRTGALPPYKADFLTNYEVGWKTTLFDNRLRWNGAVFWEQWKDFQYSFLIQNGNGLTGIANAGQARIKGLEMDVTLAVATGLTLSGGLSYLDTELTENYCGIQGVTSNPCVDPTDPTNVFAPLAPKGSELPLSPKFKGNLTGRYQFQAGTLDSFVQASAVYNGSRKADLRELQQEILGDMKAYTTVSLSGGFSWGASSVELFINNVFDEHASLYRYAECEETICGTGDPAGGHPGIVYSVPNQPRTIGLKFAQKFD